MTLSSQEDNRKNQVPSQLMIANKSNNFILETVMKAVMLRLIHRLTQFLIFNPFTLVDIHVDRMEEYNLLTLQE